MMNPRNEQTIERVVNGIPESEARAIIYERVKTPLLPAIKEVYRHPGTYRLMFGAMCTILVSAILILVGSVMYYSGSQYSTYELPDGNHIMIYKGFISNSDVELKAVAVEKTYRIAPEVSIAAIAIFFIGIIIFTKKKAQIIIPPQTQSERQKMKQALEKWRVSGEYPEFRHLKNVEYIDVNSAKTSPVREEVK